jgi:hypothetical protein
MYRHQLNNFVYLVILYILLCFASRDQRVLYSVVVVSSPKV